MGLCFGSDSRDDPSSAATSSLRPASSYIGTKISTSVSVSVKPAEDLHSTAAPPTTHVNIYVPIRTTSRRLCTWRDGGGCLDAHRHSCSKCLVPDCSQSCRSETLMTVQLLNRTARCQGIWMDAAKCLFSCSFSTVWMEGNRCQLHVIKSQMQC